MSSLDQTRAMYEGTEYDWLLADSNDEIALCCTAGYGEMPDLLLTLGHTQLEEYFEAIDKLLEDLPETGTFREEGKGMGADVPTLGYSKRGLYVYDWKHMTGPYQRVVVPSNPIRIGSLEKTIEKYLPFIPSVGIEFNNSAVFQLRELTPCRTTRMD